MKSFDDRPIDLVRNWSISDVSAWLRQNGFANLVELFAKHQIDGDILLSMSETDMATSPLNITIFGQIRKMGLALSKLRMDEELALNDIKYRQLEFTSHSVPPKTEPFETKFPSAPAFTNQNSVPIAEPENAISICRNQIQPNDVDSPEPALQSEQPLPENINGESREQPESTKCDNNETPNNIVPGGFSDGNEISAEMHENVPQIEKAQSMPSEEEPEVSKVRIESTSTIDMSSTEVFSQTETKSEVVLSECRQYQTIAGTFVDNVHAMEELYPDMCWRYQESQMHILDKIPDGTANSGSALSGFDAKLSFVTSPVEFYVQPRLLLSKIHALIESMEEYYDHHPESVAADRIYKNMPCAVKYTVDEKYYRAIIIEKGHEDAHVQFVDWGNRQFEKLAGIKPLKMTFGRLPPLAFRCRLEGVKERTLVQKRVESFTGEMENLPDKNLIVSLVDTDHQEKLLHVRLFHPQTKTDIGQKYLPRDTIIPPSAEFYKKQIRECDERLAAQKVKEETGTTPAEVEPVETAGSTADPSESAETPESEPTMQELLATAGFVSHIVTSEERNDLDSKTAKMASGHYSNDLEAFLDGCPGFMDGEEDSDDEGARPRNKKLKQLRREAELKQLGKWTAAQQKLSNGFAAPPPQAQTFRHMDGREYIKTFMKPVRPPRGDLRVVVHKVVSAREIYLYLEQHVPTINQMQEVMQEVLDGCVAPPLFSVFRPGPDLACAYRSPSDSMWHRACVSEVYKHSNRVRVTCIDQALSEVIGAAEAMALPTASALFSYEPQVLRCQLKYLCEVIPVQAQTDLLIEQLPVGQVFVGNFERDRSGGEPWLVRLHDVRRMTDVLTRIEELIIARNLQPRIEQQRQRLTALVLAIPSAPLQHRGVIDGFGQRNTNADDMPPSFRSLRRPVHENFPVAENGINAPAYRTANNFNLPENGNELPASSFSPVTSFPVRSRK